MEDRAVGLMTLSTEIDISMLVENFELDEFDNLQQVPENEQDIVPSDPTIVSILKPIQN